MQLQIAIRFPKIPSIVGENRAVCPHSVTTFKKRLMAPFCCVAFLALLQSFNKTTICFVEIL
jgi:hypothetical protein